MYEYTCAMCGKTVVTQSKHDVRMFCSKKCYGQFVHLKREREADVPMPRLTDIHPDGYDALVCAIIKQAREDVLSYSPNNHIRQEAEDFFLSDWFAQLTDDLDGFEILYKLTEIYNERQRRKAKERKTARV